MKKLLIIGYDPGTTAALAILDSKGKLLFLKSKKGFKKSEILKLITGTGKPFIVAGDRRPLPKSVEKLARTLSCRTFYPKNSLTNEEKERIVKESNLEVKNDHEKDALAACLHAFKSYSKFFKRIEMILDEKGLSELYDEVIELILLGKAENIKEAIKRLTEKESPESRKEGLEKVLSKLRKRIGELEKYVFILRKSNESLRIKLRMKEREIENLKERLRKRVDSSFWIKKLERLKKDLEELSSLTEKLKFFRKLELKGFFPLIEVEEAEKSQLENLDKKLDLEGRVIYLKNPEKAQVLNDYKIKALILKEEPGNEILEKVEFPVLAEKNISIEHIKNLLVVKKEELEEEIKKARKIGFIKWLEGYRKREI